MFYTKIFYKNLWAPLFSSMGFWTTLLVPLKVLFFLSDSCHCSRNRYPLYKSHLGKSAAPIVRSHSLRNTHCFPCSLRCFRDLSLQTDWRLIEYRDHMLLLSGIHWKQLGQWSVTSDHWPPNLEQCLKKRDCLCFCLRSSCVYAWPTGIMNMELEYELPWYQGRGRVFASLLALEAKNRIFIRSLVWSTFEQVIKLYWIFFFYSVTGFITFQEIYLTK